MKSRKPSTMFALLALVMLLVAACVAPAPMTSDMAGADEDQPVDLSMWYFNWPPGYEYQAERVRIYMDENPNVTIDFDHSIPPVGEGGFEDKVTSSLATGTAPDIFAVINPQAIKLINKGQLAPIDDEALEGLGFDSVDALKGQPPAGGVRLVVVRRWHALRLPLGVELARALLQ